MNMFSFTRYAFILISLYGLTACQSDPRVVLNIESATIAGGYDPLNTHEIFIATNRTKSADGLNFGEGRARSVSYASYAVSVPSNHEPGAIEWPNKNPDLSREFGTVNVDHMDDQNNFSNVLNLRLGKLPAAHREAVVFIHGFNTNFVEGLFRFTQIVHDFKIRAIPLHYSWPSRGKARAYIYDRDSMHVARDGLEETLNTLARSEVSGITIVAHSMGGLLTVETLRQMAIRVSPTFRNKLKGVILISPDIDADVFRSQLSQMKPLPKPFVIFVSQQDKALKLSAKLSGKAERVGTLSSSDQLSGLDVTLVDVSKFEGGDSLGHMTAATSPAMISLLNQLPRVGNKAASLLNKSSNEPQNGGIVRAGAAARIVLAPFGR